MNATDIESIQRYYPQIYLACHLRHVRAASTPYRLSASDSALLAHLSTTDPVTPTDLAKHLGIGTSTLSAAIRRLSGLGYMNRTPNARDRRIVGLTLTALGAKAMAGTSVLDPARVTRILARLTAAERRQAVNGLSFLARAARDIMLDLDRKE